MITSAQNPRVRQIALLMEKSRKRREEGIFVIEGIRELNIALQSGYSISELYYCPAILRDPFSVLPLKQNSFPVEELDPRIYDKLAYRGTTEGIVALMHSRDLSPEQIPLKENPLIIVLESVEKPGNLGAILRTADAVAADAVLVCDPLTDIYNPNIIRASLGCLFSVPTVPCSSETAFAWLSSRHIGIVAANCQSDRLYHQADYSGPIAVVMGTEDKGLSLFWRTRADLNIKIPMRGRIDSLNVSVATAVLCFEIVRQRNK